MILKYGKSLPAITTEQMIEVDRLMIEEYRIELIQMMENAGRCLAIVARERFLQPQSAAHVLVLAGTGGNGGGAMVCARRLSSWGHHVVVWVSSRSKMTAIPAHQLDILERMNITVSEEQPTIEGVDLVIDGIIGYSVQGDPRGKAQEMIEYANESVAPVLSLDTPSGLDLTTGTIHNPTIKAAATLTLALPKKGLLLQDAREVVGDLFLGDISVPPSLYHSMGIDLADELFNGSDVLEITP